jgi:hypothetical protein
MNALRCRGARFFTGTGRGASSADEEELPPHDFAPLAEMESAPMAPTEARKRRREKLFL